MGIGPVDSISAVFDPCVVDQANLKVTCRVANPGTAMNEWATLLFDLSYIVNPIHPPTVQ